MAWEMVEYDPTGPKVDKRHGMVNASQWAKEGQWVNVKSSNVAGIRYDYTSKRLFVEFKGGVVYSYEAVPPQVAKSMFSATSLGRFVWQRLRDRYSYRKLLMPRQRGMPRRRRRR